MARWRRIVSRILNLVFLRGLWAYLGHWLQRRREHAVQVGRELGDLTFSLPSDDGKSYRNVRVNDAAHYKVSSAVAS